MLDRNPVLQQNDVSECSCTELLQKRHLTQFGITGHFLDSYLLVSCARGSGV